MSERNVKVRAREREMVGRIARASETPGVTSSKDDHVPTASPLPSDPAEYVVIDARQVGNSER